VLNLRIAARTGAGRRDHNEDDLRYGIADGRAFAVLSDGAGGHRNGALASDLAVRLVAMRLQAAPLVLATALDTAVHEAHELLMQQQSGAPERERMYATLVALWVDLECGCALWSHAGDSRLYVLRGRRLHHVTRDDSAIAQLLDAGLVDPAAVTSHPLKHQLLNALGVTGDFEAHTIQKPFALAAGDALLLCSDGWWEPLSVDAIEASLAAASSPEQWLAAMEGAIAGAARPQQDNYSAVAAWVYA
jgi:serine/threonine protein phosphatase PrpC